MPLPVYFIYLKYAVYKQEFFAAIASHDAHVYSNMISVTIKQK
ncbi:hypothetical protein COO91_06151 [Nostoc flagelliforme CCNUN1]|uniref:Uncharacterized protein n=1 Tax=Nostoc flagelliforme CCNUN1 TaxID=2038116 RepID=A0A2K8SXI0_9NOSO|nr:hypothetical protein COO91_06151 [Nostoc flagelliforme CCNUN1]